jgi:hypothetical protein
MRESATAQDTSTGPCDESHMSEPAILGRQRACCLLKIAATWQPECHSTTHRRTMRGSDDLVPQHGPFFCKVGLSHIAFAMADESPLTLKWDRLSSSWSRAALSLGMRDVACQQTVAHNLPTLAHCITLMTGIVDRRGEG